MKRTDQLKPGDLVRINRNIQRTVKSVGPCGYVNRDGEPILTVLYAEGDTEEWGPGNSTSASDLWEYEGEQPSLFDLGVLSG